MKKYNNIAIFISFFSLWMDSYLSANSQVILGFILIFTFGILHGANDLILIKSSVNENRTHSFYKILSYYLMVVLAGILLFYILPQIGLILFIIISAYHFGEQQWQILQNNIPKLLASVFYFLYGFTILLILFVIHAEEVEKIILNITGYQISQEYFTLLLYTSVTAYIVLNLYLYLKLKKIKMKLLMELFYLILFTVIFKSSSLIWGFAIYFIYWHSIPSIIDQIKYLNGSISMKNFIIYCKSAVLYWVVSILGITFLYWVLRDTHLFNAVFFSFLAAITFPHAFVITRMLQRKFVL